MSAQYRAAARNLLAKMISELAWEEVLTPARGEGTLLYPLAVHNALAGAMNRAADLGVPLVNADLVRGG